MQAESQATLIERSAIARKLGGVEFIRRLPITDRLIVNAEIALELQRGRAAKKCATKAFFIFEKKLEPEQLAKFAFKYELTEQFPRIIRTARETDSHLDFMLICAEAAEDPARQKGLYAEMVRTEISYNNIWLARVLAADRGVPKSVVEKAVKRLYKSRLNRHDCDGAESLASEFKLSRERDHARVASILDSMRQLKFPDAERKAARWGLGKAFMKKAALTVYSEFMEKEEFPKAAEVAGHFKAFAEMKAAFFCEFKRLKSEKKYREAALYAKDCGMIEQMHSAGGLAVSAEEKRSISGAAKLAKEIGLIKRAQRLARRMIAVSVERRDYLRGAEIAEEYGLEELRRELLITAVEVEAEKGTFSALRRARRAGLGEEVDALAREFFLKWMEAGEYAKAWKFIEQTGIAEEMAKVLKELQRIVGPRL